MSFFDEKDMLKNLKRLQEEMFTRACVGDGHNSNSCTRAEAASAFADLVHAEVAWRRQQDRDARKNEKKTPQGSTPAP